MFVVVHLPLLSYYAPGACVSAWAPLDFAVKNITLSYLDFIWDMCGRFTNSKIFVQYAMFSTSLFSLLLHETENVLYADNN